MKFLPLLLCSCILPFILGCMPAAHSFNSGSLLLPGDISWTYGYGRSIAAVPLDSIGNPAESVDSSFSSATKLWSRHSLQYRLGILDSLPFGTGLDIGVKAELSYFRTVYKSTRAYNGDPYGNSGSGKELAGGSPPAVEFSVRTGLPQKVLGRGLLRHNVTIGWMLGAWVDNGWFLDYAAGLEQEKVTPYLNQRFMLCPTNIDFGNFSPDNNDFFTHHDRHFMMRSSAGLSLKTGSRWTLLPDRLIPEVSLLYPKFSELTPLGFSFQLGLSWTK